MAPLNATSLCLRSAPAEITTVIQDPFGFGYEGRVAVSRELSRRRAVIATVLSQFASRSKPAPHSVQYQYFLSHGYYSPEELKDHPGNPSKKDKDLESPSAEESNEAAEETRMREQNEYLAKKELKRWWAREARMRRWGARYHVMDGRDCGCAFCLELQAIQHSFPW